MGDYNEIFGDMRGQQLGEKDMDKYNNNIGRIIGSHAENEKDCDELCKKARDMGLYRTYRAGTTPTYYHNFSNKLK
jgi:hypothetical protein